jgi:hypothetical protein
MTATEVKLCPLCKRLPEGEESDGVYVGGWYRKTQWCEEGGGGQMVEIKPCWKCLCKVPREQFHEFARNVLMGAGVGLAQIQLLGAPAINTPGMFAQEEKKGIEQFERMPAEGVAAYIEPAIAAGINITNKRYYSQLAAFPGDPEAWVDDRDEARNLLKRRNWGCPELGVESERTAPAKPSLDDDLVDEFIANKLYDSGQETLTKKEYLGLREEVIATHGKQD